jgi:hypothetical protein
MPRSAYPQYLLELWRRQAAWANRQRNAQAEWPAAASGRVEESGENTGPLRLWNTNWFAVRLPTARLWW